MKVKELIEMLKELPQEANLFVDLGDEDELRAPWLHMVAEADIGVRKRRIERSSMRVAGRPCQETSNCEQGVVLYVDKKTN
jgi:hypothetical protein